MSMFDYQCPKCGCAFIGIQKHTNYDVCCPYCKYVGVDRVFTGEVHFRLFGEGFTKRTHRDTGEFA